MPDDLIDRLTDDPDFLSLSETDQDKMYEELSGQQTRSSSKIGWLGHQQQVESDIAGRTSRIQDFIHPKSPREAFLNAIMPIRNLGAVGEALYSPPSNAALALQRGQPTQVIPDFIKGLTGQRVAQASDVFKAAGMPAPLATATGVATETLLTPGGAKAVTEIPGAVRGGVKALMNIFHGRAVLTNPELLAMSEAQVAKLPSALRAEYVTLKSQAAKEALLPGFQHQNEALAALGQQSQEALQLKAIQQQESLQRQRLDFQAQAAKVEQARKLQVQQVGRSAPSVARESLKDLSTTFRPLAKAHSDAYVSGMNDALANAEAASGTEITFTQKEVDQAIANKYLQPTQAGTPPISQEENPQAYQELTGLLKQHGIVNQQEVSARQLLNVAKGESKQIGASAKQLLRPYTPQEVAHQHLHDLLLDLLKSKGIDVSAVDAGWKAWAPVRNLGLKLQTEAGPAKLISIVRGRNPVAAEHLKSLQALLPDGEPLDATTRKVFEQLDSLTQQKVVEQAKAAEFDRVMQSHQSAFRRGQLAEKSALKTSQRTAQTVLSEQQRVAQQSIGETAMEQKRRIDAMAQHRTIIRRIIYGAALATASQTPLGKGVVRGTFDFLANHQ